jgi:hypothetical protein
LFAVQRFFSGREGAGRIFSVLRTLVSSQGMTETDQKIGFLIKTFVLLVLK